MISVLVPTFGRAQRLPAVVENISANTATGHEILLVVEPDDRASIDTAKRLPARTVLNERSRNYAGAINTGFAHATGDYVFAGADDLNFHPGWDTAALAEMRGGIRVVGTNDLLNPGVLRGAGATHYLIGRCYIEQTGGVAGERPGMVLFEGYDHQFTDTEFIATAAARGVFAPCLASVAEHMHPAGGKAAFDATYAKGHAKVHEDEQVFRSREHLWASARLLEPVI